VAIASASAATARRKPDRPRSVGRRRAGRAEVGRVLVILAKVF